MTDEYDSGHLARNTDRETSHEAAASLDLTLNERAWEVVRACLHRTRWATHRMLGDLLVDARLYPDWETARRQVRTMHEVMQLLEYVYNEDGTLKKLKNKSGRKGQALQLAETPPALVLVVPQPKSKRPPPLFPLE